MLAYNFEPKRDMVSNLINTSGADLTPYRVVVLDTANEGGVKTAGAGAVNVYGILMPSNETTDGLIPVGRPCDVVVGGEYLVEIASDVNVGDLLVVADNTGRVRALTSNELGNITGTSTKVGVIGIAKQSVQFASGKSVLVVCVIEKQIVQIPVTS